MSCNYTWCFETQNFFLGKQMLFSLFKEWYPKMLIFFLIFKYHSKFTIKSIMSAKQTKKKSFSQKLILKSWALFQDLRFNMHGIEKLFKDSLKLYENLYKANAHYNETLNYLRMHPY